MALCSGTSAQVSVSDDFTQANDPLASDGTPRWKTFNGACMTAGDGTGSIPACVGLPYYAGQTLWGGNSGKLPDPAGSGALRFTNGNNSGSGFANGYNQAGSVISNFTFASGAGLQITFNTVTYRGNSGGTGADGADGMSFFLMDGSHTPYDSGAFGGSLGYTCSNSNNDPTLRADGTPRQFDGLAYGYLGLGIDEYGNFLNQSDNTASGFGYQPGRIGLRGAGSISWGALHALDPVHYPSSLTNAQQASAVQNTCESGFIWDYSKATSPKQTTTGVPDYAAITGGYTVLSGVKIANEAAMKRGDATPISYNLKITQDGLLSLSYSYNGGVYQPVLSKQSIKSNGTIPANLRFGFAGSTGGSTNIHEIMCFQATPSDLAATSVGVNEKDATKIATGTQAFLAFYYPNDWTGRLTANNLLYNSATQVLSISGTANWDASCNLTGVVAGQTCTGTGAAGPISAQGSTSRTILTWNGTAGTPFEWNSLTTAQQNALDLGDSSPLNANRVSYLRGDRTNEINAAGVGAFRARDSVLGDIVDSSPTWVGPPSSPYPSSWTDLIHTGATAPENTGSQTYGQFLTGPAQTRLNVVYTGANDGLLHGFRSGAFDSGGNYVGTLNDGLEVLAYMPGAVLSNNIHGVVANPSPPPATVVNPALDYSSPQYAHNYDIDATPDEDDLFYANIGCAGGCWHTWVVGGLGAGGAALYALDVTDPTTFSESNAGRTVIGEWTPTTIACANVSNCGRNLGNTYGVPVIRRLHNGTWAVIFGNGFGSTNGDAGIYIMTVDPVTAVKTFYYLSTGKAGSNGIAYVSPADLDGDRIVDYVYAGDLLGNIWRFDLTSTNPSAWAVGSTPLFTVSPAQPITTKLLLAIVPQPTGPSRMMVDFGTGQKFPVTLTAAASYAAGSQSLYGIWDWNMSAWNTLSASAGRLASLPAPQTVATPNLTVQTFSSPASEVRDVTTNNICWAGSTTCGSGNTQFGWILALPGTSEQVVFNPVLFQNAFVVNTTIPANNSPLNCQTNTDTGYTIAVGVGTGGALGSFFKNYNDAAAAGSQTDGSGSPFFVSAAGQYFLLTQTTGGGCTVNCPITCPPGSPLCTPPINSSAPSGKRITWIERR
jgi:type IV pilus assembly protein PilY1